MERVRFKAIQKPSGLKGVLMLEAQDMVDELASFLRVQRSYGKERQEKEPEYELAFDVEIRRWYKRRSMDANNLAWELATRLARAARVSKETVYYAVKELVELPREEYKGKRIPRASADLTTVEFARFVEQLVIECQTHDPPVNIYDIWILFTDWRFGQEADPLEGTYASAEDYRAKRPCCESCGRFLLVTDNFGVRGHAGQIAHIVSRGSGGSDADWNLLVLCAGCHTADKDAQHQAGWEPLLQRAPHLRKKVERARERSGKHPLDAPTAAPVQAETRPARIDKDKQAMLDKLAEMGKQAPAAEDGQFELPADF